MQTLIIEPNNHLSYEMLSQFMEKSHQLSLSKAAEQAVNQSVDFINDIIANNDPIYGVNTGVGKLANVRIAPDKLLQLQRNLVLSHACGTGPLLDDAIVRLIMVLKIQSLARGYSGIRLETLKALMQLVNAGVYPCIPSKGSVGASGDLAPLAHMTLPLLGLGEVRYQGKILPAIEGLKIAGLSPIELAPKEGLALLNGTQVSTALALQALWHTENIFGAAIASGALSLIAAQGNNIPFDERIHQLRGQTGQKETAVVYRQLLSNYKQNRKVRPRIQDPYSLRCQPQVMGACLDHIRFAADIFIKEANGVSDNPLIFADDNVVLTGGNFHAQPIAMAADTLALSIAEIGALSERRIALLIDTSLSGLPDFLTPEPGINSGFMVAQVTAASLASENKSLAHPASVDSIPTSANQEDHVSMATFAARRLHEMVDNTATIIAIELIAACQGIDLRKAHQSLSTELKQVMTLVRQHAPFQEGDSYYAENIEAMKQLVIDGGIKIKMSISL